MFDDFARDKFNDLFDEYVELEEQKAHIRESQKIMKEEMAIVLSESKSVVGKVLSYLIKQRGKGENELEKIYEIIESLEQ